jgi:hypothetical protein
VQIDRTFSLLLETASGFELEPIPRSARDVARRATTERSAISRIVAKVLRPDCGGGGTGWTGGALMPRHGSGRSGRAPSNSAPTSSTREGTVFAGSVVDASLGCCVSRIRRGAAMGRCDALLIDPLLHSDSVASANRSSSDFGRVAQVARGRSLVHAGLGVAPALRSRTRRRFQGRPARGSPRARWPRPGISQKSSAGPQHSVSHERWCVEAEEPMMGSVE